MHLHSFVALGGAGAEPVLVQAGTIIACAERASGRTPPAGATGGSDQFGRRPQRREFDDILAGVGKELLTVMTSSISQRSCSTSASGPQVVATGAPTPPANPRQPLELPLGCLPSAWPGLPSTNAELRRRPLASMTQVAGRRQSFAEPGEGRRQGRRRRAPEGARGGARIARPLFHSGGPVFRFCLGRATGGVNTRNS